MELVSARGERPQAVDATSSPLLLRASVDMAPKGKTTPFQQSHVREFGLRIASRDVRGVVDAVQCVACVHLGREIDPSEESGARKRKATEREQMWHTPYRKKNFRSHMEQQHSTFWKKYNVLSFVAKDTYFNSHSEKRLDRTPMVKRTVWWFMRII
eukprot:Plantae.Rhodophyta-Palmaria_palmata.ctg8160.p2 GENE.Plantae.Rhodophyta-Palmaria_palmata.ctg8160~~Plantae.Rhodophyta-Palmaria_palmata.ctg8160.p2  ORF type:complete len:156 (-),score=15.47 Plantae.Rhodophyta-Palmaria_palmata.ctg8160:686-1153(-)